MIQGGLLSILLLGFTSVISIVYGLYYMVRTGSGFIA